MPQAPGMCDEVDYKKLTPAEVRQANTQGAEGMQVYTLHMYVQGVAWQL
jgi:hypothetical protein